MLHLLSICLRLNSKIVTKVFVEDVLASLFDLACTAQDNIDLKQRVAQVKDKLHCPK